MSKTCEKWLQTGCLPRLALPNYNLETSLCKNYFILGPLIFTFKSKYSQGFRFVSSQAYCELQNLGSKLNSQN